MNACQRAIPVMPGTFPGMMPMTVPGTVPMQGPIPMAMPSQGSGDFSSMSQGGEDMMDGMMQGTGQGMVPGGAPVTAGGGTLPSQVPLFTSPFETAPGSPTGLDVEYTQGYLRTQIGKRMRVTFLLGTNTIQDREGILEKVGVSYIILKEAQTGNLTLCDIYSIKFVVIFSYI